MFCAAFLVELVCGFCGASRVWVVCGDLGSSRDIDFRASKVLGLRRLGSRCFPGFGRLCDAELLFLELESLNSTSSSGRYALWVKELGSEATDVWSVLQW